MQHGGRRPSSNPGNGAGRGAGSSHRSHSQQLHEADSGGTEPLLGEGYDEGSPTKRAQPTGSTGGNGLFWKLSVVAAVVLIGFVISQQVSAASLQRGLDYMKEHSGSMMPVFCLVNIAVVLVCLPGAIPQMLAGAIYGVPIGATLSYFGTFMGQVAAFMLGRHLFRDALSVWMVRRFPSWPAVETAIFRPQGGRWGAVKMLLLLRLSPAMPDSLMSYALALTSVHFPLYAGVSALALVPYCSIGAYMGSVSSDIIKSITGGGSGDDSDAPKSGNALKITFAVVSIVMFIAMAMYVGAVLRKAVAQATAANASNGGSSSSGGTSSGSASDDEDQGAAEKRPLMGGAQITLTESGPAAAVLRGQQHAPVYTSGGGGADGVGARQVVSVQEV